MVAGRFAGDGRIKEVFWVQFMAHSRLFILTIQVFVRVVDLYKSLLFGLPIRSLFWHS